MAANILLVVCIAAALVPIVQIVILCLQWRNELYIVTPRRVIQIEGIFGKHTEDSSLNMINDLILDQSVWGRMLNFGDLQVVTGNDLGDKLQGVADPFAFKRALLAAREQYAQPLNTPARSVCLHRTAANRPATGRRADTDRATRRSARPGRDLRAEFDAKRAELLRRI